MRGERVDPGHDRHLRGDVGVAHVQTDARARIADGVDHLQQRARIGIQNVFDHDGEVRRTVGEKVAEESGGLFGEPLREVDPGNEAGVNHHAAHPVAVAEPRGLVQPEPRDLAHLRIDGAGGEFGERGVQYEPVGLRQERAGVSVPAFKVGIEVHRRAEIVQLQTEAVPGGHGPGGVGNGGQIEAAAKTAQCDSP